MHHLDFAFLMLKKIKQLLLSLACMIILIHAVVPHHHHNNTTTLCLSQLSHSTCENTDSCTSNHNHDSNNDCNESDCTIDDLYAPKDNHEIKTYLDINTLISGWYIISFFDFSLNDILKNKGIDFRREFLPLIFKNPHVDAIFGLRAPPQF